MLVVFSPVLFTVSSLYDALSLCILYSAVIKIVILEGGEE